MMASNAVESDVLATGGLRLELDGALAVLVLDRPERRNVMSNTTFAALAAVPDLLPPEVRVVLIRAEGTMFSAGLDLRLTTPEGIPGEKSLADITAGDDASVQDWIAGIQTAFAWPRERSWITVAAIQGAAIGGGFQLALSADIRVLATDARFSMREVALGIVPDLAGTQNLSALIGYSRTLEICATARWVDAEEAMALGLASAVVPPDQLTERALALCSAILANPAPAVSTVKELTRGADQRNPVTQAAVERRAQLPLLRALSARQTGAVPTRRERNGDERRHLLVDGVLVIVCVGSIAEVELELGYRFTGTHLGLALHATDRAVVEQVISQAAECLGADGFLLTRQDTELWLGWLRFPAPLPSTRLAALRATFDHADVYVCAGTPGVGIEGFRQSSEEALATANLRRRLDGSDQFLCYQNVSLELCLLGDEPRARRFVEAELGDLNTSGERAERARRTLLTFLASGSISQAAAQLFLHENTVRTRVVQAQEMLAADLRCRRAEVLVALRLRALLGDPD
jgi:enoyl-CoA hydratase/carnithine racemase